jgi:hypothetical protein
MATDPYRFPKACHTLPAYFFTPAPPHQHLGPWRVRVDGKQVQQVRQQVLGLLLHR